MIVRIIRGIPLWALLPGLLVLGILPALLLDQFAVQSRTLSALGIVWSVFLAGVAGVEVRRRLRGWTRLEDG